MVEKNKQDFYFVGFIGWPQESPATIARQWLHPSTDGFLYTREDHRVVFCTFGVLPPLKCLS